MYYIYAHKNNKNEIVYIGVGKRKRLSVSYNTFPTYSKLWLNYFKDYTPQLEVLLENLIKEEAFLQEWLAIKTLKPILNQKSGGPNGKFFIKKPCSENKKNAIREGQKGRTDYKSGKLHPMYGKKHSYTSLAINAANNGQTSFYAFDKITGEKYGPFFFKKHASDFLNIPCSANISSCLNGRIRSYKGYRFIRTEEN